MTEKINIVHQELANLIKNGGPGTVYSLTCTEKRGRLRPVCSYVEFREAYNQIASLLCAFAVRKLDKFPVMDGTVQIGVLENNYSSLKFERKTEGFLSYAKDGQGDAADMVGFLVSRGNWPKRMAQFVRGTNTMMDAAYNLGTVLYSYEYQPWTATGGNGSISLSKRVEEALQLFAREGFRLNNEMRIQELLKLQEAKGQLMLVFE